MKKAWKYFVAVVLPVSGLSALFGSCASTTACNNDACYDRNISSADPYKAGDIAAWGSEKEVAKQEQDKEEKAEGRMNITRFNR